jgi:RimJ/RimL family protein N-acetyltransferase
MLSVRVADLSDSKEIFEWRNDETTRQMSHIDNIVDWDEHRNWFNSTLKSQSQFLLICHIEEASQKIAAVRFDLNKNIAIISINLSPSIRNKGWAMPCLKEAINYFTANFSSISIIEAEIKSMNLASIKAFESVGFTFDRENNEIRYYSFII